ncbi:MAG: helix-turn-helix domain-containing protein [Bdellovibrionota bacterium]
MANKRLRKELLEGFDALAAIGIVDGATMREFRADLLDTVPNFSPSDIRNLRESFNLSQGVFAALLNVSVSTIQKWEQGQKDPGAPAHKLLQIVKENGIRILV